jgi:hypothetical protein
MSRLCPSGQARRSFEAGLRAGLPLHQLRAAHKDRMLARQAVQQVLEREGVALA